MDIELVNINRRNFLKGATASLVLSSLGLQGMDAVYPEKNYRVALIGTGWYGKSDLFRLMQVSPVEVVAICDVDKNQLEQAKQLIQQRNPKSKPATYTDHQQMLASHQFDIVLIATPDHWHALQAIDAMKAGAHLYLQKPISVDVVEGEAIVAASKKYNRFVQVGTQRRSTPHLIEAKENIIDKGLLGKIAHVEMFCYYHMRSNNNPAVQPIPNFLDYERWCGPAPLLPYRGLPHGGYWRGYMEYSNGIVGDMCVHLLDAVRWMLKLGWPKRISSTGGIYIQKEGASNIADTQTAMFEFDELNCVWQHRTWGVADDPEYPWGYRLIGEKGTLVCSPFQYDFYPSGEGKRIHRDARYEREKFPEDLKEEGIEIHTAPATRQHFLNLLQAITENKKPVATVEEAHISTASCILANMAMKLERPLVYDLAAKLVKNDVEATKLLSRDYRKPWAHP